MSSSVLYNNVFQAKIGNVQNQADSSSVYSAGVWSFKNSTALTSVTITDAGNVGIGTASPSTVLDLRRGAGIGVAVTLSANGNAPSSGNFELSQAGDNSCYVWNRSNNIIAFGTNNAERMRIDASGNLQVGAANAAPSIGGQFRLNLTTDNGTNKWGVGPYSNTASNFYVANSAGTGVYLVSGQTTWTANSDRRLKKNIKPLEFGLEQIKALKPSRFDYNTDESEESARVGFIAQEVLPVLPHAVHVPEDSEQMMGVSATEMIPVLVKAIQELEARLAALESK